MPGERISPFDVCLVPCTQCLAPAKHFCADVRTGRSLATNHGVRRQDALKARGAGRVCAAMGCEKPALADSKWCEFHKKHWGE